MGRKHYLALDGLRGVAAIAVAAGHTTHVLGVQLGVKSTALAVDFFFMLSGFVIAHAYADRLRGGHLLEYLLARVVRLYPMIVAGTLIGLAYRLLLEGPSLGLARLALQGAALIPEIGPTPYPLTFLPLDPPAWSLFFEMVASLLFGLGLWRGRLGMTAAAVVASAVLLAYFVGRHGGIDEGWRFNRLHVGLLRVMFGFGFGVLLYRFHKSGRVPTLGAPFLLLAAMFGFLLIVPEPSFPFELGCVFVVFPILILIAAQAREDDCAGLSRWSGNLSYPLYILHWPLYLWVGLAAPFLGLRGVPLALAALTAATLSSLTLLKVYDEPVRRWLMGYVRRM